MAFIQIVTNSEGNEFESFMVSDSVGANAANWWTDIQLVQYLIGFIYIYSSKGGCMWKQTMTSAELANLPNPHTDFKRLSKTADLIRRFQTDAMKQGDRVFVDGRIDRALGLTSSLSKTSYAILLANDYFGDCISVTQGREDYVQWSMNEDPDMPDMLKGQLNASEKVIEV